MNRRSDANRDHSAKRRSTRDTGDDLATLGGVWTVASVRADGMSMPRDSFSDARLHVSGDHFVSRGMGAPYEGTLVLDPSTKPKSCELLITLGHASGTRHLGIYTLARDRLTLCLAPTGRDRPKAFGSAAGSGIVLQVLHRETAAAAIPDQHRSGPRSRRLDETTDSDSLAKVGTPLASPTAIDGDWAMETGVFNGVAMAQSMVKWCKRTVAGDVTVVSAGPRVMLKARFALDTAPRPWRIDYVNPEGTDKGKSQLGIVELRRDSLRICMGPAGAERPTEFESFAGDRRSFTTWRRP